MRILKIELPGVLHSKSADLALDDPAVQARLGRELDGLRVDLAERIRAKATAYLPPGYTLFVRVTFEPPGTKARVLFWIDDPAVSGLSGLLARRAWQLSIPILSHVVREAIQERLQTLAIEVDEGHAKVASFAPTRALYSPGVIALLAALACSIYFLFAHDAILSAARRVISG